MDITSDSQVVSFEAMIGDGEGFVVVVVSSSLHVVLIDASTSEESEEVAALWPAVVETIVEEGRQAIVGLVVVAFDSVVAVVHTFRIQRCFKHAIQA